MPWFLYVQNNSGGHFEVNDNVCRQVYIEASSINDAEAKAEALGIYYDGCEKGLDCPCCGDRWYGADELKSSTKELEELVQELADKYGWTVPDARLFYADGMVKEIFSSKLK